MAVESNVASSGGEGWEVVSRNRKERRQNKEEAPIVPTPVKGTQTMPRINIPSSLIHSYTFIFFILIFVLKTKQID